MTKVAIAAAILVNEKFEFSEDHCTVQTYEPGEYAEMPDGAKAYGISQGYIELSGELSKSDSTENKKQDKPEE
ncbi:hypothetical protein [Catenovulum sediminis]|uniref:hypothetical protein n=1 Tax=Catenovulum sediminis TaxID=1740262 RepID=UPI00117E726B|nr:hypothetical protein [Catenovulum sediminis]